jgi:inositol phosphorylceramide mannosyltransferase catalytic subunit
MTERIPRRIIQIWGGGKEPPLLNKAASSSVRLMNPEFEYRLFDDEQMSRFLRDHFPQYIAVFEGFELPIQRYDFFRYLAVYQLGGFYFDMDILLARGLDDLLSFGCVFPFERLTWSDFLRERHGMDWEIGNYAFGAAAGHPFMRAIIDNCVRARTDAAWRDAIMQPLPRLLREDLKVIYTTGPGLVSRTLAEYRDGAHPVRVLFPKDVCDRSQWNHFGDHGVHLMGSSWRSKRGPVMGRVMTLLQNRNARRAITLARKESAPRAARLGLC